MLAWHTVLKTPHYPEGREVVFIANDVTVQSGSFGVKEDEFFYKVCICHAFMLYLCLLCVLV